MVDFKLLDFNVSPSLTTCISQARHSLEMACLYLAPLSCRLSCSKFIPRKITTQYALASRRHGGAQSALRWTWAPVFVESTLANHITNRQMADILHLFLIAAGMLSVMVERKGIRLLLIARSSSFRLTIPLVLIPCFRGRASFFTFLMSFFSWLLDFACKKRGIESLQRYKNIFFEEETSPTRHSTTFPILQPGLNYLVGFHQSNEVNSYFDFLTSYPLRFF